MATTNTQEVKQADIRYRVELKNKPYIAVYVVRSSDDTTDYHVTVVRGKVSSCTCPAVKPCYHWKDCQKAEDARRARLEAEKREKAPLNGNQGFVMMR